MSHGPNADFSVPAIEPAAPTAAVTEAINPRSEELPSPTLSAFGTSIIAHGRTSSSRVSDTASTAVARTSGRSRSWKKSVMLDIISNRNTRLANTHTTREIADVAPASSGGPQCRALGSNIRSSDP